jgi:hypothetical protein
MNTINSIESKRSLWQSITILTLGFWLSSSLILDWVIMPSLYVSGMMTQTGFASAGYVIFWNFNRVELLAAGLLLTAVLAVRNTQSYSRPANTILAVLLLAVCLVETYFLTPQMSAIGINLDLFQAVETPANMNLLHGGYWMLEVVKLGLGGVLLKNCWHS